MKRKPLRETMAENAKVMDMYAKLSGHPTPASYTALTMHGRPQKAPRAVPKPSGIPLEADVSKAVAQLLAVHPNVKFAVRQNSGAAYLPGKNGASVPVWFWKFVKRSGIEMRVTDYWGMLQDGRMVSIEVKRPGWKKPTDQREREQANFIGAVGFGGFVTCVEDAEKLLNVKGG